MAAVKRVKAVPLLALPELDEHDVFALKALNNGVATKEQQERAVDVILKKVCRINMLSYVEGDPSARDFNEGRKKVAYDLLTVFTVPAHKLTTRKQND